MTHNNQTSIPALDPHQLFSVFLEAVPVGACILDTDLRWLYINRRLADMNGLSVEDHIGRSVADVLPDLYQPAKSLLERVLTERAPIADELVAELASEPGRRRTFREIWHPIMRDGAVVAVAAIVDEVTEERELARNLEDSRARESRLLQELQEVLHLAPAAIWISRDPEGAHVEGNPEAKRLLRQRTIAVTERDRTPVRFLDGVTRRELAWEELPMQRAAASGQPVRDADIALCFPDGTEAYIYGNAAPILNEQGSVAGAVGAYVDVTPMRQTQMALEEMSRRKDRFLAMLAHELRNPLAPIRNAAEMLTRGDAATLERMRAIIVRQVGHMSRLVDDLLDVSRLRTGKITLRREPVDLRGAVRNAVDATRTDFEAKNHCLQTQLGDLPSTVDGDPVRLTQIAVNLLTNAARYTPPGGHIKVSIESAGGKVRLVVADNGIGIRPDLLLDVFDLFAQGDTSLAREGGGLGIGLTLVRQLAELHGGGIEASSAGEGRGSTFTLTLPAAPVREQIQRQPSPAACMASRRVLIIEDNVDVAESEAMVLRAAGHDVCVAGDGPAGVRAFEEFHPDIVLLDIGLPGMTGYAVALAIRRLPRGDVPIVALSGYSDGKTSEKGREAGFTAMVVKPTPPEALQSLIGSLTSVAACGTAGNA